MADLLFDSEEVDVEFDMTNLLRADSAARSAYINTGVMNGTLTRNEGRAMEGRMPIDGLDEPLRPLNMVEESYAEDEEADAEAAESPAQEAKEPPDEKDGAAATRMQAMIQSNAARVARRLSKSLEGDVVALVSDALAVSAESAIAWFAEKQPTDETELTASLVRLGSNA
jgi:hypothetical protein